MRMFNRPGSPPALFHKKFLSGTVRPVEESGDKLEWSGSHGGEGRGLWVEMGYRAKKIKNGQDFISQPHLPPTDTTFPFPTLS